MDKKVYLVGAGPGDESLLTLKALEAIKIADVIIYDNLVNESLLGFTKENSEKIYVGKKINQHTLSQTAINELLIQKAKENKIVVRLKGGDPFLFGRGGEEALALIKEKISCEVIPGITSAISVPAYAGIPVTHRGISSSVHIITGHEDPEKEQEAINYKVLAQLEGTLVFLMGLNNLSKICEQLKINGKSPDTPVAVISKGTSTEQKVAIGNLNNIIDQLNNITYPAIIVVGAVVNLREKLNWFESRPLFGKNILVTRSRHQASTLVKKITEAGGTPIEFPTIEIKPFNDESNLNEVFSKLIEYQWIIFTSVNGVEVFFNKLFNSGRDIRSIGYAKIAAIGEATRKAIEEYHINVDLTPEEYIAESLIISLKGSINKGDKILIPRAEVARKVLPEELEQIGARVDVIALYETITPIYKEHKLEEILNQIDIICFTSSSTVTNFIKILGEDKIKLLENKIVACIGPITANTARESGIKVTFIAAEHTIDGLVSELIAQT